MRRARRAENQGRGSQRRAARAQGVPRNDRVLNRKTPSLAIGDQPTASQARVAQGNSEIRLCVPPGPGRCPPGSAASSPVLIASVVPSNSGVRPHARRWLLPSVEQRLGGRARRGSVIAGAAPTRSARVCAGENAPRRSGRVGGFLHPRCGRSPCISSRARSGGPVPGPPPAPPGGRRPARPRSGRPTSGRGRSRAAAAPPARTLRAP